MKINTSGLLVANAMTYLGLIQPLSDSGVCAHILCSAEVHRLYTTSE